MKSMNAMLVEDESKRRKEFATILAFDVKTLPEAELYSKKNHVKILSASIIYHLCDMYKDWQKLCVDERKAEARKDACFPCVLKIVAIFNKKDPIVLGVNVKEGVLKIGTSLCIFHEKEVKQP